MQRIDEQLDQPMGGPPERPRPGVVGTVRAHRAMTTAVVCAVAAAVVMGVLMAQRGPGPVEVVEVAPTGEDPLVGDQTDDTSEPDPQPDAEADPPPVPANDGQPDPGPVAVARPAEPAPPAGPAPGDAPARIEVRDQRLYLVDADGGVLRTLRDAHDGSQEYTLRNVALRPGSTTDDLAVAFVEGYMTGNLSVLVVRDGGAPEVVPLTVVDYDAHDLQGMALPAGIWSPDGGMLAWLEPDPANRAVLRAVRWTASGPAGDATPAGGIPVDPEGLMTADETRGLELAGWESGPAEHLRAGAYHPHQEGVRRLYTIGVKRQDKQLRAQPLARS
ncbi:MAG: hypothetical protein WD250_11050 [Egibacteraceae bacterium]